MNDSEDVIKLVKKLTEKVRLKFRHYREPMPNTKIIQEKFIEGDSRF